MQIAQTKPYEWCRQWDECQSIAQRKRPNGAWKAFSKKIENELYKDPAPTSPKAAIDIEYGNNMPKCVDKNQRNLIIIELAKQVYINYVSHQIGF